MTVCHNRLALIVAEFELQRKLHFKPNLDFFKYIKIGRKRYHKLLRNEADITFQEMRRLADYFDVDVLELHERTLPLLENPIEAVLSFH